MRHLRLSDLDGLDDADCPPAQDAPVRRFSGRLGLNTAIEQALNVPDDDGAGFQAET